MLSKIQKTIYPLSVILFISFLLFSFKIVNIALILLLIASFLDINQGWEDLKNYYKANKVIISIVLILVLYQFGRAIFSDDFSDKRIGFLGLLFVSFFALFKVVDFKKIFNIVILVVFSLVILGSYNIYQYYITSEEFNMSVGGHIDPMLIAARPYLGYMLNIAIILSFYIFSKIKSKDRYLYLGLALLFICYMIFIAIRIQLVSLACIGVVYFVFYNRMKLLYKVGLIIVLGLLSITLLFISPTLKDRFEVSTLMSTNVIDRLAEKEPRIVIWRCSKGISEEASFNPLFGVGKKEIIDTKLLRCYEEKTINNPMRQYFLDAQFGTHNLFIEFYLLSGIIGLVLLLSLFLYLSVKVRRNFFAFALVVILFNFCFVENLLDGQLGAYLLGFTLFLALFLNNNDINQKNMNLN